VLVQLPGVSDADRLRELIGTTAQLTFRPVTAVLTPGAPGYDEGPDCTAPVDERLQLADDESGILCGATDPAVAADEGAEFAGAVVTKYEVGPAALTGDRINDAFPVVEGRGYAVSLDLDQQGAQEFAAITGELACERDAGRPGLLAIVLDQVVESATTMNPDVRCGVGITGGRAQITTGAGLSLEEQRQEAEDLALVLRTGALPISLEPATFETVSPTLGAESLRAGLLAGIIGLVLVGIWLIVFYRWLGVVALASLGSSACSCSRSSRCSARSGSRSRSRGGRHHRVDRHHRRLVDHLLRADPRRGQPRQDRTDGGPSGVRLRVPHQPGRQHRDAGRRGDPVLPRRRTGPWVRPDARHGDPARPAHPVGLHPAGRLPAQHHQAPDETDRASGRDRPAAGHAAGVGGPDEDADHRLRRQQRALGDHLRRPHRAQPHGAARTRARPVDRLRRRHLLPAHRRAWRRHRRGVADGRRVGRSRGRRRPDPASRTTGRPARSCAPPPYEPGSPQAVAIEDALAEVASPGELSVSFVGPTWGERITRQALEALLVFLVVVVLYISLRLEFKMAIAAVVALVHDVFITIGLYALVGFNVSPATVIALLTILGYSLYDTVVVFDRIKENSISLGDPGRRTYAELVNGSMNEVLYRSLNTSITSLLPVGALLFLGGQVLGATTLQDLALALFIGMAVGVYSSLFVAGPVLAWWKAREPEEQRRIAKARRADALARGEELPASAPAPGSPESRAPITTEYVRGEGRRRKRRR
jgi:preprotein translocase SecF subunit